jgi:hypothetical protein
MRLAFRKGLHSFLNQRSGMFGLENAEQVSVHCTSREESVKNEKQWLPFFLIKMGIIVFTFPLGILSKKFPLSE